MVVPHSRPFVGSAEASAAARVVLTGHLAAGKVTRRLERRWCELTNTAEALCVGSGSAALRLGLKILDVGPGDQVIVPAYTCAAVLNAVLALGATPVLADVGFTALTVAASDVRRRVTTTSKAIIAVHQFGYPVDPDSFTFGVPVVEDCAHGIGGLCGGRVFGSVGTLSISSFYATKLIAAGEGGILASRDSHLVERARQRVGSRSELVDSRCAVDHWSDVHAAIGLEQLKKVPSILVQRSRRAGAYDEMLESAVKQGLVVLPAHMPGRIWYRYALALTSPIARQVCDLAHRRGVRIEQPVNDLRGCTYWTDDLPNASAAFDHVVSLPLYPDLAESEQRLVVDTLLSSLQHLTRRCPSSASPTRVRTRRRSVARNGAQIRGVQRGPSSTAASSVPG